MLRTTLIILSIAISAALYFASSSISDTMVKVQAEQMRARTGYTDILVQAWWESPSRYFSRETISGLEDYFEYAVGTVSGYGLYQYGDNLNQGVNLYGIDFDELNKITPVDLKEELDIYPFVGKKIILSRLTANKYKLNVGSNIQLKINGVRQKFKICGIAQIEGPFIGDSRTVCGVVPPETIRTLYDVRGKIDNLYLKLNNPANKQLMIQLLSGRYKQFNVREPFTEREVRTESNKVKLLFTALTIILSFMSIYIINSTFKVITFERLPNIGTFRSIGAEKKRIKRMLILESLIYGGAGGIFGCLLGVGVLYLMSILTMPSWEDGYRAAISFKPVQLLVTFVISVLLCLISSVKPIRKLNKISIKDIILNATVSAKTSGVFRAIAGSMLMGFGILAPMLVKGPNSAIINTISIMAIIASIVMIVPLITKLFIKLLDPVYSVVFGNEGSLAVKNLRNNRSIIGSISLLAIGISGFLFINTLIYSSFQEQENHYNRSTYEIYMSIKNADKALLQTVKSTPGVKAVTAAKGIGGIDLLNYNDVIGYTEGVDTKEYLKYINLQLPGNRQQILDMLDQGRGILITNRLRDRFGITLGDELDLRAWGKVQTYKVIGFFEGIVSGGSYAIISDKYQKLDMGWSDDFYSTLYIKTDDDPVKVVKNLMERFAKQQPYIRTLGDLKSESMRMNEQVYMIAKGFSIMTLFAGILGIFNNLIINFMQRRRHLAMYRSIGMSKKQMIKMIFIEAFTIGVIGSLMGTLSGALMSFIGSWFLKSLQLDTKIQYSGTQLIMCLIIGIVISVIISTGPAYKSSKLNLMESIKYE